MKLEPEVEWLMAHTLRGLCTTEDGSDISIAVDLLCRSWWKDTDELYELHCRIGFEPGIVWTEDDERTLNSWCDIITIEDVCEAIVECRATEDDAS